MEVWFVSDIHLKTQEERNSQILLRFLHSLQAKDPQRTELFLMGDIFDLWIGGHQYFAAQFKPLITALKILRDRGMKITYIEGNHDVHVEGFFQKVLGIEVFVEAQYRQIDGLTLRLEHGDLINLNDQTYLKYRRLIRHPWIKPLGTIIPGAFWHYLGKKASKRSRDQSSHYRAQNEQELVRMIRYHAERAYAEKPFDVIISGHMHVFDDYKIKSPATGNQEIRSINLGSWFEDPVRILCLRDREWAWVEIA